MQGNRTLLWIGLGSNHIGAEGVWAFSQSLRDNNSLLWMGLGGNELGDKGALHLATLLQGDLTHAFTDTNTHCCTDNVCSLASIGLGGNEIRDEGAGHLAQALKFNTSLRSLGLGGNQICECWYCYPL